MKFITRFAVGLYIFQYLVIQGATEQIILNLNPLIASLENCTVEIVEFAERKSFILYNQILTPFILTVLKPNVPKFGIESKIFKLRKYKCYSTFILLAPNELNFNSTNNILDTLLRNRRRNPGLDSSLKYFFIINFISGSDKNDTFELNILRPFFFNNFKHDSLPPVFTVVVEETGTLKTDAANIYGWFFCWYCFDNQPERKQFIADNYPQKYFTKYPFKCKSLNACFDEMTLCYKTAIQNGQNVVWSLSLRGTTEETIYAIAKGKIETGYHPWRTSALNLRDSTAAFIIEGLNLSSYTNLSSTSWIECPNLFFGIIYCSKCVVYLMGTTSQFRFITPDGVYNIRGSLEIFINPLNPSIWYCIFLASVVISFLIASVKLLAYPRRSLLHFVKEILHSWSWLMSALVEESGGYAQSQDGSHNPAGKRFTTINVGIWLLMALVLVSAYKGALQSDFSILNPFETKWVSFRQLHNFSFILILEAHLCTQKIINNFSLNNAEIVCYDTAIDMNVHCELSQIQFTLYYLLTREMAMSQERSNASLVQFLNKNRMYVHKLRETTFFLCEQNIQQFFLDHRNNTKVAFVFAETKFDDTWHMITQNSGNVPLGHNMKSKNKAFLLTWAGFTIPSGVNKFHSVIPKRIKVLTSSGIYWFWEQWDKFRNGKRKFKSKSTFKPLSMRGSSFYVIFYAYFIGVSCALILLTSELSWSHLTDLLGKHFCFASWSV
ncbi:unnamed protein product [Allacma fusca]|uniref:Uncharacterized protein n=1 Tax=Allacma fusca TaxID=39272 RepID=A0A8J2L3M2_9HEXA|nr:unnamed protein product [Allacma fusca]